MARKKNKDQLQHQADVDAGFNHVSDKDNGACLTKHFGRYKEGEGCSFRWQSRRKMESHKTLYDYPAYKKLCDPNLTITTAQFDTAPGSKFPRWPSWYSATLTPPKPGDWNVNTGSNFRRKCYVPYWHEAHHIVPGSVLTNSLVDYANTTVDPDAMLRVLRRGLLDETYNLNHLVNMITLPLDPPVGAALELPLHRKTAQLLDHATYSRHVKSQLSSALNITFESYDGHDIPEYRPLKRKIVTMSNNLYGDIILAERGALDSMESDDFVGNE
jgi:hypothetical protein